MADSLNDRIQDKIDDMRLVLGDLEDLAHELDEDDEQPSDEAPDQDEEPRPPVTGKHPSDVLDLRRWTIMLPTGAQGDPDNRYVIGESIRDALFVRDGGVVFRAPASGFHSPNSKYPRCEAREMRDGDWTKAAWSSSGSHSLECELAIDARGLSKRKRINGMQIHNGADDVCQIMRHETQGLGLMHNDGKAWEPIDPDYVDGTRFVCKIVAAGDRIEVAYNGRTVAVVPKKGTGWYWKMGCYLQSNAANWGEPADAFGEVTIYRYELA